MSRNLDSRVEIACPIYDEDIKAEIIKTMDICWSDNVKAREICAKQLNNYVMNDNDAVRSQYATYQYYKNQILN